MSKCMEKEMQNMESLCVRGGGTLGKRVVRELVENGRNVNYIADTNERKFAETENEIPIISIKDAVQLYKKNIISKFIIPNKYGVATIKEIVSELLEYDAEEESILIYKVGSAENDIEWENFNTYKKRLLFYFIDFFCYEEVATLCKKVKQKAVTLNSNLKDKKIILIGENWLSRYILNNISRPCEVKQFLDKKEVANNNNILLVCDETLMEFCTFEYLDDNIIHIYELFWSYYYSNASWYMTFSQIAKKTSAEGIVTGISTVRDAIKRNNLINMANVAQDIYYDYFLLKRYLNSIKEEDTYIKYVIMGIGPLVLRFDMSIYKDSRELVLSYYPYIKKIHNKENAEFFSCFYEYEEKKLNALIPKIDFEDCFFNYYFKGKCGLLDFGDQEFNPDKMTLTEEKKLQAMIDNTFCKSRNENTIDENKKIIDQYLRLCKETHKKVLIFVPPYTQFYKKYWPYDCMGEVKEYIESLKKQYSFQMLDLSNLELENSCFYDYLHLNKKGRFIVEQHIDEALRKLEQD